MDNQLIGLIFCSGKGSRLMPLTKKIPKPLLLKYKGKTFLELNIEKLHRLGARHIYVNYSYGFKHFKKVVSRFKEKITLIHEVEPLGHGKTIFNLCKNLENSSLLYTINGDTIAELDSKSFLQEHKEKKVDFSIFSNTNTPIPRNLIVDKEGNLVGCNIKNRDYFYTEKPQNFIYKNTIGEYLINPEDINSLPQEKFDHPFVGLFGNNDLIEILLKQGKVVKCKEVNINRYISINTKEEYNKLISIS